MRPSWDEYFLELTKVISTRSTCIRRQVGCVIVRHNRILTTGFNGAPSGCTHCETGGCYRELNAVPSGERQELCRAVHAEQNALMQAARHGVSTEGAVAYVTTQPCVTCMKMLINAGVLAVHYVGDYPDVMAASFAAEANVRLIKHAVKE